MISTIDRKMFAPLRRGEPTTVEAKLCAILGTREAGMTAATLADELGRLAVGARASVRTRVAELLDGLEQAGTIERIPDGRYRVVRLQR